MKYLVTLMVVTAATAAYVPTAEYGGVFLQECIGKSNMYQTYNVAHRTDCTKFYKCLGNYGFEETCPLLNKTQLFFDQELQVCNWEGGRNCEDWPGTTTTPPTPTTTTPGGVDHPDCSVHPERKKPHADKHKYYQCVNGIPEERDCLANTYFNPVIAECDLPLFE